MGNFTFDIGIDDAGEGKDVIDGYALSFLFGLIGRYHDGGILTAGRGVFGNGNGEFYFVSFVGGDGAGGFGNSNPLGDLGIS